MYCGGEQCCTYVYITNPCKKESWFGSCSSSEDGQVKMATSKKVTRNNVREFVLKKKTEKLFNLYFKIYTHAFLP